MRKVEVARTAISQAHGGGFQGMQIGAGAGNGGVVAVIWSRINIVARGFVRQHSDLAMTHVAAYYKGYVRAARDVATIIEESGTCGVVALLPIALDSSSNSPLRSRAAIFDSQDWNRYFTRISQLTFAHALVDRLPASLF